MGSHNHVTSEIPQSDGGFMNFDLTCELDFPSKYTHWFFIDHLMLGNETFSRTLACKIRMCVSDFLSHPPLHSEQSLTIHLF